MTRRVLLISCLAIVLGVSMSSGEWKMRVHRVGGVDEYVLAEVDSVTFYDDTSTPPVIGVPAGTFVMGDGVAFCGVDEHEVTLTRDFYFGKREVTNQEYLVSLQWAYDNGHVTANMSTANDNLDGSNRQLLDLASEFSEIQYDGAGTFYLRESPSSEAQGAYPNGYDPAVHPVKEVSWFGAVRYCDWLSMQAEPPLPRAYQHTGDWSCNGGDPYGAEGYRLPTDAEWEYAAQFDDERTFPWGETAPNCSLANYVGCVGWSSPVGSYADAPEELGLSDMGGNMWEWCNDRFMCNLGMDNVTDPTGPSTGPDRVIRGSAWLSGGEPMRCAQRASLTPDWSWSHDGFRIARTVDPGP